MKITQDYPFIKKIMHIKITSFYNTIGTIKIWNLWTMITRNASLACYCSEFQISFNSSDKNFWRINIFQRQLIPTSFPSLSTSLLSLHHSMDMKRKINVCIFMSIIFILIQIKFDSDINNDESLRNHMGTQEEKNKVDCHL
jgi:hypothetical protein